MEHLYAFRLDIKIDFHHSSDDTITHEPLLVRLKDGFCRAIIQLEHKW